VRGDAVCLPHFEPVATSGDGAAFPFGLVSYKTMTHAEGRGANQPNLQELFDVQFDRHWESWIEIDPKDALALGIRQEDEVWLETPTGRMRLKAVVEDTVRRGVVAVPFEHGHTAYGRWAAGRGDNVNRVSPVGRDPLVGTVAWYDARVAVKKA
jgi:anaerobic selenocysteine-containing dehydrogenase